MAMTGVDKLSKQELLALLDTAGHLSAETDPQALIEIILATACRMTDSPDGSVLLFDPERNGLYFAAAQGDKAQQLLEGWGERSNQRVPLRESNAGDAFTQGKMIVDKQAKRFQEVDRQTGKKSQSILSIPLRVRGKTIGVLQLLNKINAAAHPVNYESRDFVIIEQLGRQAAIAIDNAQLISKLLANMGLYSRKDASDLIERLHLQAKGEQLTLLFADMRGFTQLCQWMQPIQTQKIVNELLTMYADQVLNFGGIVNKFMGDAVFAIFRHDDAPNEAVRCAFGMIDHFQSLRDSWSRVCNQDIRFLDLGIGVVTGEVALGSFGSAAVRDFTAIGTPVNLAHALEGAARDGKRILVDQATWMSVQGMIADSEELDLLELRKPGQAEGVKFRQYQLKRLKPEMPVRVFISHNSKDRDLANQITQQLAQCGIETWYSAHDVIPGQNYIEAIRSGLMKSDWFLVIVSAASTNSDWVRAEVKTAVEDRRFRERILPIKVDDSAVALISADITTLQAIDGRALPNPGEAIRDFLLLREKELRSKAIVS